MEEQSLSYIERSKKGVDETEQSAVISRKIEQSIEKEGVSTEGWKEMEVYMRELGFTEKETEPYLSSLMMHHGNEIIVRRGSLHRMFSSLEHKNPMPIHALDAEPNAAILGNGKSEVNGIEVALTGGFGWFVDKKVAGVYGFLPSRSLLECDRINADSNSRSKEGAELMRRVDGDLDPEDILFVLFRIHKSAYPEELMKDEDFDEKTGEANQFILRLYAKSRQVH